MTAVAFRKFVLNADDFGMDEGVDAAVLDLASRGVVTAASAMVLSPRWTEASKALAKAPLSKGLHLDFTSPFATGRAEECSITAFVMRAYSQRLNRHQLRSSIQRQLGLYEDVMGAAPEFVDGHRHVHQLPIIRQELINCLLNRYVGGIKVRICTPKRWRGVEAAMVGFSGARALRRLAEALSRGTNTDFCGVYSFGRNANLPRLWRRWLEGASGSLPLIMCHPASSLPAQPKLPDPIRQARLREYDWLKSDDFRELCMEIRMVPAQW
ncbi:MAG: ChbG/HpnK family deacetylase [Rhodomicrobium sp.]